VVAEVLEGGLGSVDGNLVGGGGVSDHGAGSEEGVDVGGGLYRVVSVEKSARERGGRSREKKRKKEKERKRTCLMLRSTSMVKRGVSGRVRRK
jgi:hypothetical protein